MSEVILGEPPDGPFDKIFSILFGKTQSVKLRISRCKPITLLEILSSFLSFEKEIYPFLFYDL